MGDSVQDFFEEIPAIASQLQRGPSSLGFDRAEYILMVGSEYASTVDMFERRLYSDIQMAEINSDTMIRNYSIAQIYELHQSLRSLQFYLHNLLVHFSTTLEELNITDNGNTGSPLGASNTTAISWPVARDGRRGRPRILISRKHLETLEEFGFSFAACASILGVTTQTLRNRRRHFGMELGSERYSVISDNELDHEIADILQVSPEIGERCMIGALRSRGFRLQRWRVRDAIMRVDPISRACRRRRLTLRRQYNLPAPNALW
eukprot:Seg3465.5 transcript_id=Seg3465.5/GoldUCD/mRNA.D3Y31 product="hypothetical protein" protein_id=Seg3465.5/GoldUCD/D3Y31